MYILYINLKEGKYFMKKTLAVLFAILFTFSCVSIMAFADSASADASAEVNSETIFLVPETITINNVSYVICPYCDKVCGSSEAYATHLESCSDYQDFKVASTTNTCYYCGKQLKNEKALNEHYEYYVNEKNHIKTCPFTGEDYVDGGCGATFTIKKEYDRHVAQCTYDGQYSTKGYLKLFLNKLKDFLIGAVTGADWGALKGLIAGMDTGLLKDMANALFGALGLGFSI